MFSKRQLIERYRKRANRYDFTANLYNLIGILRGILAPSEPEPPETDTATASGFLVACVLFFEDEE